MLYRLNDETFEADSLEDLAVMLFKSSRARKPNTSFICKTRFYDSVSQSWEQVHTTDLDNMLESERVVRPTLLVAKDTTVVIPTGYYAEMVSGGYVVISPS